MGVFIFTAVPLKFQNANSIDHDQMAGSVASELDLHCLHNTPKRVSGLKRVKADFFFSFSQSI